VKRFSLVACIVLSVLTLGSSLASAAGKPTSVAITNTHELNGYTVIELTAKVNPNGASTSTVIEIREEGASTWTSGETHNLSGTTVRSYSEEFQVKPVQNYEARVTATNLYGTTASSIANVSTRVRSTGEKELTNVSFGSEGVANFIIRISGITISVICSENSYGAIGNPGGKEDLYHYSMFGCVDFINGKEGVECKVSNFTFTLGGPTLSIKNTPYIPIPVTEGCSFGGGGLWWIAPNPFRVVDNGSNAEYGKTRSVSLTATGVYGTGNPAEVTIESNWYLNGPLIGTPFKIADVGL
jgi:hypothetical protein